MADDEAQNANCPPEDLDRIDPGETLWHFVLTQPEGDEATITVVVTANTKGTQADRNMGAIIPHFPA